jgi:hypothetical protein
VAWNCPHKRLAARNAWDFVFLTHVCSLSSDSTLKVSRDIFSPISEGGKGVKIKGRHVLGNISTYLRESLNMY